GVEAADAGGVGHPPGYPAGQLVAGEAPVGRQEELAVGGPAAEHQHGLQQALGGRGGSPGGLLVLLVGGAEGGGDWQGPPGAGAGDGDEDEDDQPLVPPAEGGAAVAGTDGVAVAALAEDPLAGVLIDGGGGGEVDRPCRDEAVENPAGQAASQGEEGPTA